MPPYSQRLYESITRKKGPKRFHFGPFDDKMALPTTEPDFYES